MTKSEIVDLVEQELRAFNCDEHRQTISRYLVEPLCQKRIEDLTEDSSACWLVAEFSSQVGICYKEVGKYKWGLVAPNGRFFGGDDAWHLSLQDAFFQSGFAGSLRPHGYEIP